MGAITTQSCPLTWLDNNLAALVGADRKAVESIRNAELPADLAQATCRDGTKSYTWPNEDWLSQWLGRTTMPSIRARALIDAFAPGEGNVVFFGMGQGPEIQRLLERLSSRQALYVLEPDIVTAKLCLALHDFAVDLRSGRLILLVGQDCWHQLAQFLLDNPGYLAPERMLSWPWFDHAQVHEITQQLTHVCQEVAVKRHTCRQALKLAAVSESNATPNIALLAFSSQAMSHHWARGLEWAAGQLNMRAQSYDHRTPGCVHPLATELQLSAQKPSHVVQLDVPAVDLKLQMPSAPQVLLMTHRGELPAVIPESPSEKTTVAVRTDEQFQRARISASKKQSVIRVLPAARIKTNTTAPRGQRIVVVADRIDFSAQAAGLHLASHRAIYQAAEQIVLADIDGVHIRKADEYLNSALRHLKIKLQNDEVRKGLCDRIRHILIPGLLSQEYDKLSDDSSLECRVIGLGREESACQSAPEACDDNETGMMVFVQPQRQDACAILDAIAAGVIAALYGVCPQDFEFLEGTLGNPPMVPTFATRQEALQLIKEFERDPAGVRSRWAATQQRVLESHLWTHRLDALLQACKDR